MACPSCAFACPCRSSPPDGYCRGSYVSCVFWPHLRACTPLSSLCSGPVCHAPCCCLLKPGHSVRPLLQGSTGTKAAKRKQLTLPFVLLPIGWCCHAQQSFVRESRASESGADGPGGKAAFGGAADCGHPFTVRTGCAALQHAPLPHTCQSRTGAVWMGRPGLAGQQSQLPCLLWT